MSSIFNVEKMLEFFNTIFYFLMTNLLFLIFNLPLLWFIFFVGISRIETYLPLFLVCLIPTGPALVALLYSMRQYVAYKDTTVWIPWMKSYKTNFKTALPLTLIQLSAIFILICNIQIFSSIYPILGLRIFFTLLTAILILSIPYAYLLIMRFHVSTLGALKSSLALVFTYPVLSVCNVMLFLFVLMLFELSAGTTFLFISTIYAFCVVISNRLVLKKLEVKVAC